MSARTLLPVVAAVAAAGLVLVGAVRLPTGAAGVGTATADDVAVRPTPGTVSPTSPGTGASTTPTATASGPASDPPTTDDPTAATEEAQEPADEPAAPDPDVRTAQRHLREQRYLLDRGGPHPAGRPPGAGRGAGPHDAGQLGQR